LRSDNPRSAELQEKSLPHPRKKLSRLLHSKLLSRAHWEHFAYSHWQQLSSYLHVLVIDVPLAKMLKKPVERKLVIEMRAEEKNKAFIMIPVAFNT